jgi:hypothetical protein
MDRATPPNPETGENRHGYLDTAGGLINRDLDRYKGSVWLGCGCEKSCCGL